MSMDMNDQQRQKVDAEIAHLLAQNRVDQPAKPVLSGHCHRNRYTGCRRSAQHLPCMTGNEIKKARQQLGLTLEQLGTLLGYQGKQVRSQAYDLESGRRDLREPQRRLLLAYLEGYRPKDWPE